MIPELRDLMPIRALCRLLDVSAATHYRHQKAQGGEQDLALREAIDAVTLRYPAYGYRRVTHELRRRDVTANHKRVLRVMRAEGLLCVPKRSYQKTTDSEHGERRYPNLVKQLLVTDINQVPGDDASRGPLGGLPTSPSWPSARALSTSRAYWTPFHAVVSGGRSRRTSTPI